MDEDRLHDLYDRLNTRTNPHSPYYDGPMEDDDEAYETPDQREEEPRSRSSIRSPFPPQPHNRGEHNGKHCDYEA